MKFLLSIFTVLITTFSCKSTKDVAEKSTAMQDPIFGTYSISKLVNQDILSTNLSITFEEGTNRVSGRSGCNNFFGSYTVEGDSISLDKIGSTKKFCGPEIGKVESEFLNALIAIKTFTLKDGVLSLLDGEEIIILASKAEGKPANTQGKPIKSYGNNGPSVIYEKSSRGVYEYFNISEKSIKFSKDRGLQNITNHPINSSDWAELKTLMEAVDLQSISKLEAPTDNRATDAALAATLALQIGDIHYMTPEFDHGNPPKEIEALVNKVLSIKENVIKQ